LGPHIFKYPILVHNAKRLTRLSDLTGIPIIATRQVPKNFGGIDKMITDVTWPGRTVYDKT